MIKPTATYVIGGTEYTQFTLDNAYTPFGISRNGEIINLETNRIRKSFLHRKLGYLIFDIKCYGIAKQVYVHRLVCAVYHYQDNQDFYVDHIDGDKLNNYWLNVQWTSAVQNTQKHFGTLNQEICLIAPDGTKHTTTNLYQFCKQHGLTPSRMSDVKNGKFKQHKGWTIQ